MGNLNISGYTITDDITGWVHIYFPKRVRYSCSVKIGELLKIPTPV